MLDLPSRTPSSSIECVYSFLAPQGSFVLSFSPNLLLELFASGQSIGVT